MMWFSGIRRALVVSLCLSIGRYAVCAAEAPAPPVTVQDAAGTKPGSAAAPVAAEELLKSKSLARVGSTYLLDADAKLPERMRALRSSGRCLKSSGRCLKSSGRVGNASGRVLDDSGGAAGAGERPRPAYRRLESWPSEA